MPGNVYCGTYFTHLQTWNVTRVQSATEWTASVLYTCPRYFQRGLKGGYLKEGLQGTFKELTGGCLKVTLRGGLKWGYLKVTLRGLKGGLKGGLEVTLRGGLRGGLRSP